ncbi:MAG TPA: hypothetical protein VF329_09390 [Gammaproteobacteria bacterium]
MKPKALAILVALLASTPSYAGPFTDELAKCLVRTTSEADREMLMRWVFAAMAAHPSVSELGNVSSERADELNRGAAQLFVTLLTERCKSETEQALTYEGGSAFEASFQVLGQVAMQGLMTHPQVIAFMSGLQAHIDVQAVQAAFGAP